MRSTLFVNAPAGTLFVGDKPGNHYFPRGKAKETLRVGYGVFYGGTPLWLQAGIFAPFAALTTKAITVHYYGKPIRRAAEELCAPAIAGKMTHSATHLN